MFDEREKKTPNGPGSGSSCGCAKASGLGTRYSQPLTHAGTNGARRCLTSQIGRDGVRSACCGPSRQWRQAGRRTRLRGRQLGRVQKRRAAPCAATATQGAAHRLLLGGRGASGRRRTSAKEGPTDPLLFFSFLVPSCSARPRPACDRADEASSCSAIGGRQRNAAAIRQSQSRMSDRQQQRSFPFPHACPLRLVGHACPLPQGTWVASCQDGRGRSAGSSRSGLAGSAMAVLIAD